jgi:hypothetical protein
VKREIGIWPIDTINSVMLEPPICNDRIADFRVYLRKFVVLHFTKRSI